LEKGYENTPPRPIAPNNTLNNTKCMKNINDEKSVNNAEEN
jgi:hypothetical protein